MKIKHSAIISPIFELIKTIELDIQFRDESWTTRIEIFRDTEISKFYKCNVFKTELYRITPSFPQDTHNNPIDKTDINLYSKWFIPFSKIDYSYFQANSIDDAIQIIWFIDSWRKGHKM